MKAIGLDGRERPWKLSGCRVMGPQSRPRSQLHLRARGVIRAAFPVDQVLEEVPVPGTRLRLDFLLPLRGMAVEVNGQQHYSPSGKFHRTRHDFDRQVANDRDKARFCRINDIRLVILRYDGQDDEWRRSLLAG